MEILNEFWDENSQVERKAGWKLNLKIKLYIYILLYVKGVVVVWRGWDEMKFFSSIPPVIHLPRRQSIRPVIQGHKLPITSMRLSNSNVPQQFCSVQGGLSLMMNPPLMGKNQQRRLLPKIAPLPTQRVHEWGCWKSSQGCSKNNWCFCWCKTRPTPW
jgi:hypothetical protein